MVKVNKSQGNGGFFGRSATATKVTVAIDFPRERDIVGLGHYAIRISGKAGSTVEMSINGSAWKSCRFADGYYWFDWTPVQAGKQKILARWRLGAGSWETSAERTCEVVAKINK